MNELVTLCFTFAFIQVAYGVDYFDDISYPAWSTVAATKSTVTLNPMSAAPVAELDSTSNLNSVNVASGVNAASHPISDASNISNSSDSFDNSSKQSNGLQQSSAPLTVSTTVQFPPQAATTTFSSSGVTDFVGSVDVNGPSFAAPNSTPNLNSKENSTPNQNSANVASTTILASNPTPNYSSFSNSPSSSYHSAGQSNGIQQNSPSPTVPTAIQSPPLANPQFFPTHTTNYPSVNVAPAPNVAPASPATEPGFSNNAPQSYNANQFLGQLPTGAQSYFPNQFAMQWSNGQSYPNQFAGQLPTTSYYPNQFTGQFPTTSYYPNQFPGQQLTTSSYYPNQYSGYASPYFNQILYGNTPYLPNPYYSYFSAGYMNPQMAYGMTPPLPYGIPPQAFNYNQTQNNSQARNPQHFTPYPQSVNVPAPSQPDSSTPMVVSSTSESGTDLNSLPPQVKEFVDMIPQILAMDNQPELQVPQLPQRGIKHLPLRKSPKTAASSLLKKKPYHPQYIDDPQRYGYYY